MKPKHPIHPFQVALLGIPFLLLSPAAHAQDRDKDEKAAEVAETGETKEEKSNARRAQEAARRAREAAGRAKEAAEVAVTKETEKEEGNARRANETAERPREAAEHAKNTAEVAETKETENGKGNARRAKVAAERAKEAAGRGKETAERAKKSSGKKKPAAEPKQEDEESTEPERAPEPTSQPPAEKPEPAESEATGKPDTQAKDRDRKQTIPGTRERTERRPAQEPREGRERRERPATPATPAEPAEPPAPPADESKPREETKPQENDRIPAKEKTPESAPDEPAEREIVEIPASEPERQAETEVTEVTREVQRELDQRKTRIEGREEARALIDEILGAESRISRAEIAREERFRPRFERRRPDDERFIEVSPDQRRAATNYFQQRLRGREIDGPPPEFFRRSAHRGDRRDQRYEERVVERVDFVRPRYLNEGRRYVHYDSRAAIPAILMAAQAMNHVRFQPTREIAPIFYGRQEVSAPYAMPLPPENYRNENSLVVSYPVDENSMISSEDILFLQGSTQFSDPYSYEVVAIMADAMKAMPEEERFVIEGHASAEGSYDSNMVLSQQRAEHIVREIVRRGVSPYRLLPVGYGESEARHPADAAEALRSRDRRVVVFRMKPEPVAKR